MVSKSTFKDLREELGYTEQERHEPLYYDEDADWFDGWNHTVNGWHPAENKQTQEQPCTTDVNQFHISVGNLDYEVALYIGPIRQEIVITNGHLVSKSGDVREVTIPAQNMPFLVFAAVLKDPAIFFERA